MTDKKRNKKLKTERPFPDHPRIYVSKYGEVTTVRQSAIDLPKNR